MKAEEFLRHLGTAMPDQHVLADYGLDEDEIADIQATFVAPRRPSTADPAAGELERMIVEFDCSRVEIGLVRLHGEITSRPEGLVFASCEADPLVVRADGCVAMCDHAVARSVAFVCAADSERFLDAMAVYVEFRAEKDAGKSRADAAEECAKAAGGSEYRGFYRLLCG